MSEEFEQSVVGDESQGAKYTLDATGAVVLEETAQKDKEFDEKHTDGNEWRDNLK